MSHIPEISSSLDASTQIIYNRTLVQLGLCAFSLGLIQESVNALADIVSTGKIRELLGQGISKYPVNEKEERRRLLPYHMHINIELVEAVHLIAAMLIEVPNIIIDPVEASKKQASKVFRRQYELYKNFYGTPETSRDRIMIAGKELQHGNWKKCYDHLISANIWSKITQDAQKVRLRNRNIYNCNIRLKRTFSTRLKNKLSSAMYSLSKIVMTLFPSNLLPLDLIWTKTLFMLLSAR